MVRLLIINIVSIELCIQNDTAVYLKEQLVIDQKEETKISVRIAKVIRQTKDGVEQLTKMTDVVIPIITGVAMRKAMPNAIMIKRRKMIVVGVMIMIKGNN